MSKQFVTMVGVSCRWIGSVHDPKAFEDSKINENLKNRLLSATYFCLLPGQEN